MPPKVVDRYFVINRYAGKNGERSRVLAEFDTHHKACVFALGCVLDLIALAGECLEVFEVWVGSKTRLDAELKGR